MQSVHVKWFQRFWFLLVHTFWTLHLTTGACPLFISCPTRHTTFLTGTEGPLPFFTLGSFPQSPLTTPFQKTYTSSLLGTTCPLPNLEYILFQLIILSIQQHIYLRIYYIFLLFLHSSKSFLSCSSCHTIPPTAWTSYQTEWIRA